MHRYDCLNIPARYDTYSFSFFGDADIAGECLLCIVVVVPLPPVDPSGHYASECLDYMLTFTTYHNDLRYLYSFSFTFLNTAFPSPTRKRCHHTACRFIGINAL
ncbi:hypothetical protein P691DRAFT_167308 [Macrolepiota fuliginosa MF-IS2]|uniref:Uncharacterized protein n=1 Tax=Macrolepiota fuliginosa MF-IS2 TaxID=1400762 RepID=A0A9P5X8T5_9AGAR|nr:hypothetical protein P691DRAFT_167308 [Macrolepiota fuliginosa MF-IS2]